MIILKENKMLARPHKGVFWLIDGKIWAVPFDNQKYKSGIIILEGELKLLQKMYVFYI